jgi:hypothetical protein
VLKGTPLLSGPLSGSGRREFAAEVSTNNTVRVMARNLSPSAIFDLVRATLSVTVAERR